MNSEQIFIPRPDTTTGFDRVLQRSAEQGLQLLWLLGETGQGKTWFLRHYLEEVRGDVAVSYAHCSSPLGNQSTTLLKPYQPLKDLLEDLLSNQAGNRRRQNLVKNISLTVLAMIPFVGDLAYGVKEIRRDLNEFKSGRREVDFSNFISEYLHDLKAIAEEMPVLLVMDDVQWADKPTIEALHRLFTEEEYRSARITVVLSARRDELQVAPELLSLYTQLTQKSYCTEITLPPFSTGQIEDYYHTRFPRSPRQPELLLWLEQKTGGNPFFLQSYIQHLQVEEFIDAQGQVTGDIEGYRGLPAEIRLVTNWLMKSLEEGDLTLLLTASVLGYEFSLHELMHLTQRSSLDLIRGLRRIRIRHGILETIGFRLINGKESTTFRFTQHSVHTALYNELTAEEKEALHRMTAHYLNELRLARGDDSDVQNSVASALQLHSRLGHEPELEYQSILMKAQHTAEELDEDDILEQLQSLSPMLGLPLDEIMATYRQAMQLAPLHTRHTARESVGLSVPHEEHDGEGLGVFLARILGMLNRGNGSEANILLEMHIQRAERRAVLVHPLVHILYALTCEGLGKNIDHAQRSLRSAANAPLFPSYAAIAQLGLALFGDGDDVRILEGLKKAAAYRGRHRGIVHALATWIVRTRFGNREEFAAVLASHSIAPQLRDSLQENFPKTAAAIRKHR